MSSADAQPGSLCAVTAERCSTGVAAERPAVRDFATEAEANDIASIPFVPVGATTDRQFQFCSERMVHSGRKRRSRRVWAIRSLGKEGEVSSRAVGRSQFVCSDEQDAAHRNGG